MSKPHKNRRSEVHFWIIAPFVIPIIIFYLLSLSSCSPQNGCKATRGMAGYAWLKCRETGKVIITDMDGKIVCSYYEKPSK